MSKVENVVNILGQPAVYQILSKKRARTDEEKKELAVKIEASCRRFNNNHGSLSIDEFYNVIKLQNGVEVSKDELRRLSADLDMDKNFKISIKVSYIIHFWWVRDILHEISWMYVCAMYSFIKIEPQLLVP